MFLVLVGRYKHAEEEALRRRAEVLRQLAESRLALDARRGQFARGTAGLGASGVVETVVAEVM